MDLVHARDHLRGAPPNRRMLIAMHSFATGGVASRYSAIAKEACKQGFRCVVVAADGPAREARDWGSSALVPIARWGPTAVRPLERLLDDASLTLWAATPETAPLSPLLGRTHRAVVGVHGVASLVDEWFGPERLGVLRATLGDNPGIGVVVPGSDYVPGIGRLLNLAPERVTWLPHATKAPDLRSRGAWVSGDVEATVLCPTRLSAEQRFVVNASADLAAARGAALTVVGVGNDAPWIRGHLAARGDLDFSVVEDANVAKWIAEAPVVAACGLTALEAVAAGCAVVAVSRPGGSGGMNVVTPATWPVLQERNFFGLDDSRTTADEAWALLDAFSDDDRARLAELVRRDATPEAALRVIVASAARVESDGAALVAESLPALSRGWLEAEERFEELRVWLEQVTEAREYFRGREITLQAEIDQLNAELSRRSTS